MSLWMRCLCFFALAFGLVGCAAWEESLGRPVNKGHGYAIKHDRQIYGGGVHIELQHRDFLRRQKIAEMENSMMPAEAVPAALSELPYWGYIAIHYEQTTIGAANTKWLDYVILVDGEVVLRQQGADRTANVPLDYSGGIGFWWNTDLIPVDFPLGPNFQIVVASKLDLKRDTFTITAPH